MSTLSLQNDLRLGRLAKRLVADGVITSDTKAQDFLANQVVVFYTSQGVEPRDLLAACRRLLWRQRTRFGGGAR